MSSFTKCLRCLNKFYGVESDNYCCKDCMGKEIGKVDINIKPTKSKADFRQSIGGALRTKPEPLSDKMQEAILNNPPFDIEKWL